MRVFELHYVGRRLARVIAVGLVLILCNSLATAETCQDGNLLLGRLPKVQRAVSNAARLTDGWATLDGMDWRHPDTARFIDANSEVIWDLGQEAYLRGLELQADANDIYVVSSSLNGADWETIWEAHPESGAGLKTRQWTGQSIRTRYLRLMAKGGDGAYSATELRAFCNSDTPFYPPLLVHQNLPVSHMAETTICAYSGKIAILLAGVLAIFLGMAWQKKRRPQQVIAALVIVSAAMAWTYFLTFSEGSALHASDSFHYFMGPKYFRQTGYFDLYRCVARAERELGHGDEYKDTLVRNLDDNRIWRGDWLTAEAGRCRAEFAPSRWIEFKQDVAKFRDIMPAEIPLPRVLLDHGFNATPFHVAFLRMFTLRNSPNYSTLLALAQLDSLALVLAIAAMWWGFWARRRSPFCATGWNRSPLGLPISGGDDWTPLLAGLGCIRHQRGTPQAHGLYHVCADNGRSS